MQTQYGFTDITFNQSLARARAQEAADIQAAAAGLAPKTYCPRDLIDREAQENLHKALCGL